jgi:succinyl-CoA synthetase alpha subunit
MSILADQNVRVIVQGITGREAASFTKDMMDYGTQVVAGVTPGKQGQQVHGVPVYDTVRGAVREHPAEASVISVPPGMVKGAALEALDNGIKLLVIITERVPRKDVIEFLEAAAEKGARVIGPNTLGIISPDKFTYHPWVRAEHLRWRWGRPCCRVQFPGLDPFVQRGSGYKGRGPVL